MSEIKKNSHRGGNVGLLLDYTGDSGPHWDTLFNVMTGTNFSYKGEIYVAIKYKEHF